VEKPDGTRTLGRHIRRCEGDIEIDLREVEWGAMDWIDDRIGASCWLL
jgi:hypothetical protein